MAIERTLDLFVVAGEASGDLLAAKILEPIKEKLQMGGVTGVALEKIGVQSYFSIKDLSVIGFFSLLPHLFRIIKLFTRIKKLILKENPKMVLLVDNAEFSLLMAKALRKRGFKGKIVQLVSPSIWAWRKNRKKTMEMTLDALFCIFPFELAHFENSPLDASYIGHPLFESLKQEPISNHLCFLNGKNVISLFPGSRKKEVELTLPLQLAAIEDVKGFEIAISLSSPHLREVIESIIKKSTIKAHIIESEHRYELMRKSFFALSKFGTINLELAFFEVPTITAFPIPTLERWLLQHVFKIYLPHYSIVNLIAKRRVFPEYISFFATKENLKGEVKNFIENVTSLEACKNGCREVKDQLVQKSLESASDKIISLI